MSTAFRQFRIHRHTAEVHNPSLLTLKDIREFVSKTEDMADNCPVSGLNREGSVTIGVKGLRVTDEKVNP